jgi:outer membrane protein OmpA-like peptidoglycan-associated protein
MSMIRYLSTLVIAIAAAFVACQARAEKVVVYQEGQRVDPQEVADVLGKTRSIRLLDDATPAPSAAITAATGDAPSAKRPAASAGHEQEVSASALSLPVRFAFGSAEILPEARSQLDALAKGIKLLPANRAVLVEGHTDNVGDDAYNLELSRARARAVRDYLVAHHGIEASRLKAVGYGESRPVEGSDPSAAVNRRVQFRGA